MDGPDTPPPAEFEHRDPAGRHDPAGSSTGARDRDEPCLGRDRHWMELALAEARRARDRDEVPVGAVVVLDGEVIGRGHNLTRCLGDPTAHAELRAIVEAAAHVGAARVVGAVVYTTVEPCFMCAGALSHARVERVVWGVRDPKFGGCASLGCVLTDPRANHRAQITEGVLAAEARELLQSFFRSKRGKSATSTSAGSSSTPTPDASRAGAEGLGW